MGDLAGLLAGDGTRLITGEESAALLQRVVESQPVMRPGRCTVYLGRPDPSEVRATLEEVARLLRSARRAVVVTPPTAPLRPQAERRDPGLGWLASLWFSAVLGLGSAMAVVAEGGGPRDRLWLVTEPAIVRRFVNAVEA